MKVSILTEKPPEYLIISEKKHPIRTDFKIWLKVSELMAKNTADALAEMFALIFYEMPDNLYKAVGEITEFYKHSEKKCSKKKKNIPSKRDFDYDYDSELIFAAFWQQYKIDLCESNMHWWKFKALFNCLSEDTQFIKVVQYRNMELSQIKDKDQKAFYRKMKALYRLPDNRSEEQKQADFEREFTAAFW